MLRQGLGRNRCGSRRPLLALTCRLCPHSSHGSRSIGRPRSPAKSQRLIRIRPHAKSGAAERVNRAPFPPHFLRVAASSNPSVEPAASGLRPPAAAHLKRYDDPSTYEAAPQRRVAAKFCRPRDTERGSHNCPSRRGFAWPRKWPRAFSYKFFIYLLSLDGSFCRTVTAPRILRL